MIDLNKEVVNGNGSIKISKNFIVSLLIVIILGISGWAVAKITTIPEDFATKTELDKEVCTLQEEDKKIRQKVDRNVDYVIENINRLDDRMQNQFENINRKLDSIQKTQENGAGNN